MIFDSRILNNKIGVSINDYYRNVKTLEYHHFNYFREGIADEELFNDRKTIVLKCNFDSSFHYKNNFIINNFQMNGNKNNQYYIKDGDYRKDIIFNEETQSFNTMVRGEINGQINLKSCGVEKYTDLEMLVYRRPDRQFIGKYPVNELGSYKIPNLDTNSAYDIILFDTKQKLEQQVHSLRKPKATEVPQVQVAQAKQFELISKPNSFIFKFNIRRELYKDYDFCRLVYLGINGQSYEIIRDKIPGVMSEISIYSTDIKYGFYCIESFYKNDSVRSDLVEIKEVQTIEVIVPDDVYTPPAGDNINIIVGE